jgi:hypothetical protein
MAIAITITTVATTKYVSIGGKGAAGVGVGAAGGASETTV